MFLAFEVMRKTRNSTLLRTLGLTALSGARTMMAPALLSRHLSQPTGRKRRTSDASAWSSRRTAKVLTLLAAGELVGDKLPFTPARISTPALVGRGLSGALVGAAQFKRSRRSPLAGSTVGIIGALGGAFVTYQLRKRLGEYTGVPDPVWGGVEDLLVVKAGRRLLRHE